VSVSLTVRLPLLATYTRLPSGEAMTAVGTGPTSIRRTGVQLASKTVTLPVAPGAPCTTYLWPLPAATATPLGSESTTWERGVCGWLIQASRLSTLVAIDAPADPPSMTASSRPS